MRKVVFILLAVVSASTIAGSTLSYYRETDGDTYNAADYSLSLGFAEDLIIGGRLFKATSDDDEIVQRSINLSGYVTDNLELRATFAQSEDVDDLFSSSVSFGGTYVLSALWDSDYLTTISIDINRSSYRQEEDEDEDSGTVYNTDFKQQEINLSFDHELSYSLKIIIGLTIYSYTDSSLIEETSGTTELTSSFSGISGYSDNIINLGLSYNISDWVDSEVSYSKTATVDAENDSTSINIYTSFHLTDKFDLGVNYLRVISSDSVYQTYGMGLSYFFSAI